MQLYPRRPRCIAVSGQPTAWQSCRCRERMTWPSIDNSPLAMRYRGLRRQSNRGLRRIAGRLGHLKGLPTHPLQRSGVRLRGVCQKRRRRTLKVQRNEHGSFSWPEAPKQRSSTELKPARWQRQYDRLGSNTNTCSIVQTRRNAVYCVGSIRNMVIVLPDDARANLRHISPPLLGMSFGLPWG